ncbi:MAG: thiamine phosphate synthase [Nitrospinota bacterium]|nr:thiamine phosphate synthase [Nitrospinota bacterium]
MEKISFGEAAAIYPVTGRELFRGRQDADIIAQLAAGGARVVQLRDKKLPARDYYHLSVLYRQETRRHGMLLIINDRPDIAMLCGADGVHLGQEDLPVAQARRLMGPDAIIGASSHSLAEAMAAEEQGASYVNVGPIFATSTKPGAKPIGLAPLTEAAARLKIPVTCMGGITSQNIGQALKAGGRHIGVVGAIFGRDDVAAAVAELLQAVNG